MDFDGSVIRLDLTATARARSREGHRHLDLQEQIEQLFDELREPVFRYLLSLSATPAEADELIQETFLRAFEYLRGGGRLDTPRGWVFRVSHNLAINQLKVRRRTELLDPQGWARLIAINRDLALEADGHQRVDRAYHTPSAPRASSTHCAHP